MHCKTSIMHIQYLILHKQLLKYSMLIFYGINEAVHFIQTQAFGCMILEFYSPTYPLKNPAWSDQLPLAKTQNQAGQTETPSLPVSKRC